MSGISLGDVCSCQEILTTCAPRWCNPVDAGALAAAAEAAVQRARLSNQNVNGDEGASGHWRRSLQDAGKAVYTDSSLLSGYTLKAAALQGLGRWQEAERELQVMIVNPSDR